MDRANYHLAWHLAERSEYTVHLAAHEVAEPLASHANVRVHRASRPLGSHTLGEFALRRVGRRIARYLTTADDPKPLHDPHADFWREYLEYRRFWVWAWQTFPELAEELALDLLAPDVPALEPLGRRLAQRGWPDRPGHATQSALI